MAAGGLSIGASAQSANGSMIKMDQSGLKSVEKIHQMEKNKKFVSNTGARIKALNKGTAGGSRWYNYVEHLGLINSAIFSNTTLPYMWFKPDINGIYSQTGGGVAADTIRFVSYGMTFDPLDSAQKDFNDLVYTGSIGVTNKEAYTLDSVSVYGFYGRNPAKSTIVDTLRFSFVYGSGKTTNMPIYYMSGATMQSQFGYDTVRFAAILQDVNKNIARQYTKDPTPKPAVIVKDVILTAASVNDTDANGFNKFSVAPNMNVPAANLVGATVTFKTGDTYIPYVDTAFMGSLNPSVPFNFGLFRPLFFEENKGGFPTYTPGNWNAGHIKNMPERNTSWDSVYVVTLAYTAGLTAEIPYMDFKISCPTCKKVEELNPPIGAVKDVDFGEVGNAFPNPAISQVRIPFTMSKTADVKVTVTNAVGAIIATQQVGKVMANHTSEAVFNVANYANGVYFYTVEANGQRLTKRFVVAH